MGQVRGVSSVVCPPSWWCCLQGSGAAPCICSRYLRSGSWFWSFCTFLFIIVPTAYVCSLVAYNVFILCCLRRCLSRYKHGSKGSQVPDCLTGVFLYLNIFRLFTRVRFIQFSNFNVY